MYYTFSSNFSGNVKDITDSVPKGDTSLLGHKGTEITLTHNNYNKDEFITSSETSVFVKPKWSSALWSFDEPECELPSPIPVYVDDEEGGEQLLSVYDSPFVIVRNDLITALNELGITDFSTHPVEIRDPASKKTYTNYSTFKPIQRFVHAIIEEESEVSDVIDGMTFYNSITIDPEKVNEADLFLHAIRPKSSYVIVISEAVKSIFESIAPDDFIFSGLFIEGEDEEDEDEDDEWSQLNQ